MSVISASEMLDDIQSIINMGGRRAEVFTRREIGFIEDISERMPFDLSQKQQSVIERIWDKIPTW